jgi:pimeloyl-ACP methyl ester carboxylesterase
MSDSSIVSNALDPNAFTIRRAEVKPGLELAFVHEGAGGTPLLLVHGYPETKRIWWRNIGPLVDAGFEVIAPDLRGYGDSGFAPDGFYDIAAFSTDLHALVHYGLGHTTVFAAGGDVGGPVVYDLSLRYEGFVPKLCFFNTLPPSLDAQYDAAGIPRDEPHETRATADYFTRQGRDADGLIEELDTPERRRAYIADMYGHRLWAASGSFSREETAFMTEPFADRDKLRSSWGAYEGLGGNRPMSEIPRYLEPNPLPTLVLYGPEDHVVPRSFPDKCEIAFPNCVGPFVVPRAGHFLQWERADLFNRALQHFFH